MSPRKTTLRTSASMKAKAARIMEALDALYPMPPIPLAHEDPFTLLVAVVLSAQTTDKKVNEVTPRLFRVAGTPEDFSKFLNTEVDRWAKVVKDAGIKAD